MNAREIYFQEPIDCILDKVSLFGDRFILRNKEDQILDSELGPMLHDERTPELIGEDLINYIQIKYADPDGINQRNKVSHALNPMVDFNTMIIQ